MHSDLVYLGGRRPRLPTGGPGCSEELLGLRMVSSTERMRLAASTAPVMALSLTTAGSQTNASKLLAMVSLVMSTPYHILPMVKQSDETTTRTHSLSSYTLANVMHSLTDYIEFKGTAVLCKLAEIETVVANQTLTPESHF